ncbi:MAG: hypothetical protein ACRD43_11985 [Pyrinomonadaceae bacterium]
MRKVFEIVLISTLVSGVTFAQREPVRKPAVSKAQSVVPIKEIVDKGMVSGRTYTNEKLNFSITFPDTWLVPDSDFEDYMKKQGFDLSLKAPDSLGTAERARINRSLKRVEILVTAYRSMPGSSDNAIMRVSAEDLKTNPQIKDAVDYIDAMRAMYKTMRLSPDFKYSDTQAEKLGEHQFAFIDVTSDAGKKRLYATVRGNFALLFTLSYTSADDLQAMRQILTDGNFKLK